jgi:hypothetical protein
MMELWSGLDTTARTVLVVTTLITVTAVTGFIWFMVSKSKPKK